MSRYYTIIAAGPERLRPAPMTAFAAVFAQTPPLSPHQMAQIGVMSWGIHHWWPALLTLLLVAPNAYSLMASLVKRHWKASELTDKLKFKKRVRARTDLLYQLRLISAPPILPLPPRI
jgi:hypothetical protein